MRSICKSEWFKCQFCIEKCKNIAYLSRAAAPASIDWRNNYVKAIKNQGNCGSCWEFASV
jgi:C1A family cysteine protease